MNYEKIGKFNNLLIENIFQKQNSVLIGKITKLKLDLN